MIDNAKKQLQSLEDGVLLGLSGGPDSMCLCALLMELKIQFQIAHIDHRIFPSSTKEKERLEMFAKKNSIAFHLCSLDPLPLGKKNLEEKLREKRLNFFSSVMKKNSLKVLLLGHQKEERGETVIKRFFEGGDIFNLSGIKKYTTHQGITIFRPLLDVSKKDILKYLNEKKIPYYTDLSNFTGDNLRAKMRRSLIPKLEGEFGKNIVSSICNLADQAEDLHQYIDKQIEKIKKWAIDSKYGVFYPYKEQMDLYLFNLMILKALKEKNLLVSKDQRLYIKQGVANKVFGKSLIFKNYTLYFEKVGIFFVDNKQNLNSIDIVDEDVSWLDFWKGENFLHKIGEISLSEYKNSFCKKQISEYHRKSKTPVWIRSYLPIPYRLCIYKLSKYSSIE
jgi:tRNA(Ile)-lysidine synthase